MGICWSEPPPVSPVQSRSPMYPEKVVPTAPPYQPPMGQNQYTQYTYAIKPQQQYPQYPPQVQYTYAYPQYAQQYPQQYVVQQYPAQQRPTAGPAAAAFVGGMLMGSVVEDILDPTE